MPTDPNEAQRKELEDFGNAEMAALEEEDKKGKGGAYKQTGGGIYAQKGRGKEFVISSPIKQVDVDFLNNLARMSGLDSSVLVTRAAGKDLEGNTLYRVVGERDYAEPLLNILRENDPSVTYTELSSNPPTKEKGRGNAIPATTSTRVEPTGEGGVGFTDEVREDLPGMVVRKVDTGEYQLNLTDGAREYLGRLGLVRPNERRVLLNKGAEETARILNELKKGRYVLDKPGADLVSKVRGAVPLDGDGNSAVLWVTEEQRPVLDRVLRAKGELDGAKGNPILKGPTEAAYQQWLTALINTTAATAPESSPASPKAKRSLFGPPNPEFGKEARSIVLGAAARFGLWFYFLPKYHEDTWKQTEEERREKRARKAASEPSPYSPMEAAWAPEPLPEPAVQAEPPIDWGAQFGDEGGKT